MSRQASSTSTPFWRTAHTLTILFWVGVGLAPMAAAILLLGSSDNSLRFAVILGLGSVVLIGLSIAGRRDADSVEAELTAAMADMEEQTHYSLVEMRGQLRRLAESSAPAGPHSASRQHEEPPRHRPQSDRHEMPHAPSPPRPMRDHLPDDRYGQPGPAPRLEPDHHRDPATGRNEHPQYYRDPRGEPPGHSHHGHPDPYRGGAGRPAGPGPGHAEPEPMTARHDVPPIPRPRVPVDDYRRPTPGEQQRRREAAVEETGEMVRVTESVSVTRRETTTMRPVDPGYSFAEAGAEPRGYQDPPQRTGLSEKFSKLKNARRGREDHGADVSAEADSLLSGLAPEPGHENDWYRTAGPPEPSPPRRHDASQDWDRPLPGEGTGGWRTEERSAELRMGMRQSRTAPEAEWEPRGTNRRYGPEPDRRAIADVEAQPTVRWGEAAQGEVGGSYMDRHYGGR